MSEELESKNQNKVIDCPNCGYAKCQCSDLLKESMKEHADKTIIPAFEPYKIYLLKRIFVAGPDEFNGKVIIASSAKAARKVANLKTGDEGKIWTDSNQVLCREITLTMPLVVLESFKAG